MISTMPTVACPECGHDNENERIYCHDCGARLERRRVVKAEAKQEDTQKRVKMLFDPQRAKIRALFFKISKVVLGACGCAALTVVALPPEVPPVSKELVESPMIGFDLEKLASRPQPTQVQYSEAQVNLFLMSNSKTKKQALDKPLLEFKRAMASFREGSAAVIMERAIFGYSIFTTIDFSAASKDGKATLKVEGASVGRMPIHPQIARYMNYAFADLWNLLERERKLASKVTTVEFHDKKIRLVRIPSSGGL